MIILGSKRTAVFVATALAVLLALGSTAYACTYFKGKMTILGSSSTNTSNVYGDNGWAYPDGGDSVMGYCGPIDGGAHSARDGTGTFTVTVSEVPSGHACYDSGTNQLPQDTYYVNYLNGDAFTISSTGVYSRKRDCMTAGVDGTVNLTTLSVDSSGYGKKSGIKIPVSNPNGVSDDSAICVSDSGAYDGNQAPIYIY